ncbi:MAG TPA: TauD/TfdA family dioxygenase [Thermoanaerobaculia bacterium]|nr:TauD/TfdA family dioxygenase [Thermoanaerobaculia bacterium]
MPWEAKIHRLSPQPSEQEEIHSLITDLLGGSDQKEVLSLLELAAFHAQDLPRSIREAFHAFRRHQAYDALYIDLGSLLEGKVGATPSRHRPPDEIEYATYYDVAHILFASLLGDPFGWSTIQNGYIINDVMPIPEHRDLVASSGFGSRFGLHTEDAFHPLAGDYLGLLCLRNPDGAETTLAGLGADDLPNAIFSILFESRFIVGNNVAQKVGRIGSPSPILFGNRNFPYIRVNLNATEAVQGDDLAAQALKELAAALERNAVKVCFRPGEFWYIDNLGVAHGRDVYTPRFDGSDRWLRRLYISSAFRFSLGLRTTISGHVLDPLKKIWKAYI